MNRPETIEETAALVARIEREQGALHILVNDILGLTKMEWNKKLWESDLDYGLHLLRLGIDTHAITSHFALPLMITRPGALVIEVNDGTTDYNAANSMAASQTRGGISWKCRTRESPQMLRATADRFREFIHEGRAAVTSPAARLRFYLGQVRIPIPNGRTPTEKDSTISLVPTSTTFTTPD